MIAPTRAAKFFELFDLGRVLPEMARARRDVAEPEPPQQLADRALVISDVPAGQDEPLQIDTAPAHHTVAFELRAGFDQRRQLGFLLRAQPPRRSRRLAVDQSLRSLRIKAAHPITQPLRVHGPELGRDRPILSFVGRRNRQQPTSLVGILRLPGCRPYPLGVPIRTQSDRRRHRASPAKTSSQKA